MNELNEINLKVLLIGDSSVGKTSILLKYIDDQFPELHISTIGVEYKIKTLTINEKKVVLRIWDTSGEERYRSITRNFYRNANGILFIFDITKKESFDNIKNWLLDSQIIETKVIRMLIGNKIDLEKQRKIGKEIIENYAERKEMKYYETSAKEGTNIDIIFMELAKQILSSKTEDDIIDDYNDYSYNNSSFNLSNESEKQKKKRQCC